MNFIHAIEHHPRKDSHVWGVKVYTTEQDTTGQYATIHGGYMMGRIPPACDLITAVRLYHHAVCFYKRVHLVRHFYVRDAWTRLYDDAALADTNYNPSAIYERLVKIGAIFPTNPVRSGSVPSSEPAGFAPQPSAYSADPSPALAPFTPTVASFGPGGDY